MYHLINPQIFKDQFRIMCELPDSNSMKARVSLESTIRSCFFSVASCDSDQILDGAFLATSGDLSALPTGDLS